MSDGERLVELLADHCDIRDKRCIGCEQGLPESVHCKNDRFGKVADHLIANNVVVQKQGEWEKVLPYISVGGEYKKALICPECKSFFVSDGNTPWQLHNYCPNCGAKMGGGK